MLKAMLAQNKIHLPTKVLERSIVMPRDLDNFHPGYAEIHSSLLKNPFKNETREKKKKKGRDNLDANARGLLRQGDRKKDNITGAELLRNEKFEYKVFEFGNYPMKFEDNVPKPKGGQFRLMLPAEADWTGHDAPEIEQEKRERILKQEARLIEKERKRREREVEKEREFTKYEKMLKEEMRKKNLE